jgi:hypothetical protein
MLFGGLFETFYVYALTNERHKYIVARSALNTKMHINHYLRTHKLAPLLVHGTFQQSLQHAFSSFTYNFLNLYSTLTFVS